jgi:membrane-bound serine protease (ClpP class)
LLRSLPLVLALASGARPAIAQEDEPGRVGQFYTITEPITDAIIEDIKVSTRSFLDQAAKKGVEPVLIFEFLPGESRPGETTAGNAADLADLLSSRLTGAELTVAFVPKSLSGYAVMDVLACDDIVLGERASLGPIAPAGQPPSGIAAGTLEQLALRKGRDPDLLRGMLEPSLDLREVSVAGGRTDFVPAERLPEYQKTEQVVAEKPAWRDGPRGVLTVERARDLHLAKLIASDRTKVAAQYGLDAAGDDPTLGATPVPLLLEIQGPIDAVKAAYVQRRLGQVVSEGRVNLIVLHLDSEGGLTEPVTEIARAVRDLNGRKIRTVAYVDRALGLATLVALASDEIVMDRDGQIGDVTRTVDGRGDVVPLSNPRDFKIVADYAAEYAEAKYHPVAIARAMADPSIEVVSATDSKSGARVYLTADEAAAQPGRYVGLETIKRPEEVLTLDEQTAVGLGLARASAGSLQDWLAESGLKGIRVDAPTWVDALVNTLNTPWMSWLLLFIGMFMLILELKLPGVGLPAITSALAFLLFFWGHYLGGTADKLEILLFLVGLICLAMELFVFPGFGVFGVSGILLVLISVVMASHTFIWPSQEYEYRQMGQTLTQVALTIVAVVAGAVILGRYFPSLPLFRRMILVPEPAGSIDEFEGVKPPPLDADTSLFFLVGETGRTTTVCRPSGKARIGEMLVDVTADGFYIEANSPVEVVEVRGSRVFVKKIT